MMATKRKTDRIEMRIEPRLKELAEAAAVADRRSLSSWIEQRICEGIERREQPKQGASPC
jgi:predicted HicB family RNase H-like nuclease